MPADAGRSEASAAAQPGPKTSTAVAKNRATKTAVRAQKKIRLRYTITKHVQSHSHCRGCTFWANNSGSLNSSSEKLPPVIPTLLRVPWLSFGLAHRSVGRIARAKAFEGHVSGDGGILTSSR